MSAPTIEECITHTEQFLPIGIDGIWENRTRETIRILRAVKEARERRMVIFEDGDYSGSMCDGCEGGR